MANGLPIIASAKGEIEQILMESDGGISSNPNSTEELVDNVIKMRNMMNSELETMSQNSLEFYNQNFEKNMVFEKIFNLL